MADGCRGGTALRARGADIYCKPYARVDIVCRLSEKRKKRRAKAKIDDRGFEERRPGIEALCAEGSGAPSEAMAVAAGRKGDGEEGAGRHELDGAGTAQRMQEKTWETGQRHTLYGEAQRACVGENSDGRVQCESARAPPCGLPAMGGAVGSRPCQRPAGQPQGDESAEVLRVRPSNCAESSLWRPRPLARPAEFWAWAGAARSSSE